MQFHCCRLINQRLWAVKQMRGLIIGVLAVLICVGCARSLSATYLQFQSYSKEYNKRYDSYELEFYRFALYLNNLAQIEEMNAMDEGTAVYGETMFTDLSKAEMKQFLGVLVPQDFHFSFAQNFTEYPHYKSRTDVPNTLDWRERGAVTSVKNQGSCGSCWTFSTAGNVEGQWFLKYGQLVNFSMQQLIDCDESNFGCNGGWPYKAIDWLANNRGMQTLQDYPLRTNYSGPCEFEPERAKAEVKGYMNITHDEQVIRDALYQRGPLSILLDFTDMFHYKSGVASPYWCSTWPDHALVLVGYGTKKEDYWLIKNSWGPKWGLDGYLMLKRGANKCGINLWATTAILDN